MKRIAVLGSTGSIGVQTLEVAARNRQKIEITALTAGKNHQKMLEQIMKFKPRLAALKDSSSAEELRKNLGNSVDTVVLEGTEGIIRCITESGCDMVLNAMVGISGLIPTLKAIEAGKHIALANKETLVAGGQLVTGMAVKKGVRILPVDSEHSAVFQCIGGTRKEQIERLILTASGGPFRGRKAQELENITPADALKHPNWNMGRKISIDSATLMNKGLEVIEARWLFGIMPDRIDVVVHPQSIIHSMVEFVDGAVLAQLGQPDMRIPIQYALTYPERIPSGVQRYNPLEGGNLEFFEPDTGNFPALKLAYSALEAGGTMTAVLNGANEAAVELFLDGTISFNKIPVVVERVMEKHAVFNNPGIDDIIYWDRWSRQQVVRIVEKDGGAI